MSFSEDFFVIVSKIKKWFGVQENFTHYPVVLLFWYIDPIALLFWATLLAIQKCDKAG